MTRRNLFRRLVAAALFAPAAARLRVMVDPAEPASEQTVLRIIAGTGRGSVARIKSINGTHLIMAEGFKVFPSADSLFQFAPIAPHAPGNFAAPPEFLAQGRGLATAAGKIEPESRR